MKNSSQINRNRKKFEPYSEKYLRGQKTEIREITMKKKYM